jgi:nitroreductase
MLLAAHSMGLGSCLIGFAVLTMTRDRRAKRAVGIPDEEKVHAVIALGYPNERYQRTADRKEPLVRVFETASRKETEKRTSPPGSEP